MALNVTTRYKNLNYSQALIALIHNLREIEYTIAVIKKQHADALRIGIQKDLIETNHYYKLNENDEMVEQPPMHDLQQIEALRDEMQAQIKSIYESFKDSKGRKKTLRKTAKIFHEFVVTFGSDRIRTGSADGGLNDAEVSQIRALDTKECLNNYITALKEKYHFCNFIVTEHRDEKTPHFHIICNRIDEQTGDLGRLTGTRKSLRKQYADFGSSLQDMVAEAFQPLGLKRGVKGSQAKNKKVREMREQAQMEAQALENIKEQEAELDAKKHQIEKAEQEIEQKKQKVEKILNDRREQTEIEIKERREQAEQQLQQEMEQKKKEWKGSKTYIDKQLQGMVNNTIKKAEIVTTSLFGKETISYDITKLKNGMLNLLKQGCGYQIALNEVQEMEQKKQKEIDDIKWDNNVIMADLGHLKKELGYSKDTAMGYIMSEIKSLQNYAKRSKELEQQLEQERERRLRREQEWEREKEQMEQQQKQQEQYLQTTLKQLEFLKAKYEPQQQKTQSYDLSL